MHDPRTIPNALNQVSSWYPDNTAFAQLTPDMERETTYREVDEATRQLANGFREYGLSKGDRVALLSPPTVEHAIAYLAVLKTGAIAVSIHLREAYVPMATIAEEIEPELLLFDPEFGDVAADLCEDVSGIETRIGLRPTDGSTPTLEDVREGQPMTDPDISVHDDDPAFVSFTSGSTGDPKGVVHTHADAIESAHAGEAVFAPGPDRTLFTPMEPSFIGWHQQTLPFLNTGGRILFLREWEPTTVLDILETRDTDVLLLVPTQWRMLLDAGLADRETTGIKLAGYAGEPMDRNTLKRIYDIFDGNVFSQYGTTEIMNSSLTLRPRHLPDAPIDSVGKPVPNVDARIVAPETKDPTATVDHGEAGELIIRGPSVSDQIWNDPETTDRLFHEDGWYFSGDVAVRESGFVSILGRIKNMVISGGINVYAEKVENVLSEHPEIHECAVVGEPHEKWGEIVTAHIVGEKEVTAEQLEQWCEENELLSAVERPRAWVFHEELPEISNKIDREALRSDASVERDATNESG